MVSRFCTTTLQLPENSKIDHQNKVSNHAKGQKNDKNRECDQKRTLSFQDLLKQTGLNNIQLNRLRQLHGSSPRKPSSKGFKGGKPKKKLSQDFSPYECQGDYLRSEFFRENIDDIEALLKKLLPDENSPTGYRETVISLEDGFTLAPTKKYKRALKDTATGIIVAYNVIINDGEDNKPMIVDSIPLEDEITGNKPTMKIQIMIQVGGDYIRSLKPVKRLRLYHFIKALNSKAMRVDLKYHTPAKDKVYEKAKEYQQKKQYTNMRSSQLIQDTKDDEDSGTVYIGSRNSDCCVRIYQDKWVHGTDSDSVEIELKGKKAKIAFEMLCDVSLTHIDPDTNRPVARNELEILREYQIIMANVIMGAFDFYDDIKRRANGSIKEVKVAPWWDKLKKKVLAKNPTRITAKTPIKTVETTIKWFDQQVIKSIAKALLSNSQSALDMLFDMVIDCLDRFTPKDWAEVHIWEDFWAVHSTA